MTSLGRSREWIITLKSDTQFYEALQATLQSLHTHLLTTCVNFEQQLHALARDIASLAKPISSTKSFQAYSGATSDPANVKVHAPRSHLITAHKSDLYKWREIFHLYVETEIFESHREASRGETTIEEAEQRLSLFMKRLREKGLLDGRRFHMKASQDVLGTFLQMNMFLLNVKKVCTLFGIVAC